MPVFSPTAPPTPPENKPPDPTTADEKTTQGHQGKHVALPLEIKNCVFLCQSSFLTGSTICATAHGQLQAEARGSAEKEELAECRVGSCSPRQELGTNSEGNRSKASVGRLGDKKVIHIIQ